MMRIERRFRGPTSTGNGGWTSGQLATALTAASGPGPVTVTLRRPPPLDTDLTVEIGDRTAQLLNTDGQAIAEAVAAEPDQLGDPVEPVDVAAARAAESEYAGLRQHPFPECFVCGPERDSGDGLRLFPGPVGPGRTACTWTPHPAMAGSDGRLDEPYVWAALDCPSGWAAEIELRPMVLGQITGQVHTRPRAGETHVVVGRRVRIDGRKTHSASTVYDAAGRIVGQAVQIWIVVDPSKFN